MESLSTSVIILSVLIIVHLVVRVYGENQTRKLKLQHKMRQNQASLNSKLKGGTWKR